MDPLILKVFGPKKYHYRLQMKQNLPSIILKERNFDMTFELVNENGQKILNCNSIINQLISFISVSWFVMLMDSGSQKKKQENHS